MGEIKESMRLGLEREKVREVEGMAVESIRGNDGVEIERVHVDMGTSKHEMAKVIGALRDEIVAKDLAAEKKKEEDDASEVMWRYEMLGRTFEATSNSRNGVPIYESGELSLSRELQPVEDGGEEWSLGWILGNMKDCEPLFGVETDAIAAPRKGWEPLSETGRSMALDSPVMIKKRTTVSAAATDAKVTGNLLFKRRQWIQAVNAYSTGLDILARVAQKRPQAAEGGAEKNEAAEGAAEKNVLGEFKKRSDEAYATLKATLFGNRAEAKLRVGDPTSLEDAEAAIEFQGTAKAHARKARACAQLGEYDAAVRAYAKAIQLDPSHVKWVAMKAEALALRDTTDTSSGPYLRATGRLHQVAERREFGFLRKLCREDRATLKSVKNDSRCRRAILNELRDCESVRRTVDCVYLADELEIFPVGMDLWKLATSTPKALEFVDLAQAGLTRKEWESVQCVAAKLTSHSPIRDWDAFFEALEPGKAVRTHAEAALLEWDGSTIPSSSSEKLVDYIRSRLKQVGVVKKMEETNSEVTVEFYGQFDVDSARVLSAALKLANQKVPSYLVAPLVHSNQPCLIKTALELLAQKNTTLRGLLADVAARPLVKLPSPSPDVVHKCTHVWSLVKTDRHARRTAFDILNQVGVDRLSRTADEPRKLLDSLFELLAACMNDDDEPVLVRACDCLTTMLDIVRVLPKRTPRVERDVLTKRRRLFSNVLVPVFFKVASQEAKTSTANAVASCLRILGGDVAAEIATPNLVAELELRRRGSCVPPEHLSDVSTMYADAELKKRQLDSVDFDLQSRLANAVFVSLGDKKSPKVLEVGAFAGLVGGSRPCELHVIDPCPAAVEELRRRLPSANVLQNDPRVFFKPLRNDFDLVLLTQASNHVHFDTFFAHFANATTTLALFDYEEPNFLAADDAILAGFQLVNSISFSSKRTLLLFRHRLSSTSHSNPVSNAEVPLAPGGPSLLADTLGDDLD